MLFFQSLSPNEAILVPTWEEHETKDPKKCSCKQQLLARLITRALLIAQRHAILVCEKNGSVSPWLQNNASSSRSRLIATFQRVHNQVYLNTKAAVVDVLGTLGCYPEVVDINSWILLGYIPFVHPYIWICFWRLSPISDSISYSCSYHCIPQDLSRYRAFMITRNWLEITAYITAQRNCTSF